MLYDYFLLWLWLCCKKLFLDVPSNFHSWNQFGIYHYKMRNSGVVIRWSVKDKYLFRLEQCIKNIIHFKSEFYSAMNNTYLTGVPPSPDAPRTTSSSPILAVLHFTLQVFRSIPSFSLFLLTKKRKRMLRNIYRIKWIRSLYRGCWTALITHSRKHGYERDC